MIVNNVDATRPIKYSYVGYGSELARIDVAAAKEAYNRIAYQDPSRMTAVYTKQTKIR